MYKARTPRPLLQREKALTCAWSERAWRGGRGRRRRAGWRPWGRAGQRGLRWPPSGPCRRAPPAGPSLWRAPASSSARSPTGSPATAASPAHTQRRPSVSPKADQWRGKGFSLLKRWVLDDRWAHQARVWDGPAAWRAPGSWTSEMRSSPCRGCWWTARRFPCRRRASPSLSDKRLHAPRGKKRWVSRRRGREAEEDHPEEVNPRSRRRSSSPMASMITDMGFPLDVKYSRKAVAMYTQPCADDRQRATD